MQEYNLAPWGEERADLMLAQIAQILTALKGADSSLSDFLLFHDQPTKKKARKRQKTAAQQQAVAKQLVQLFGQVKKPKHG